MKIAFPHQGLKPGLQSAILELDALIQTSVPANEERQLARRALQDVASRCVLAVEFQKLRSKSPREQVAVAAVSPLKAERIGEE